jgi:hypothetical protein
MSTWSDFCLKTKSQTIVGINFWNQKFDHLGHSSETSMNVYWLHIYSEELEAGLVLSNQSGAAS